MSETIPQDLAAVLMVATLNGNAPDRGLTELRCLDRDMKPGPREWLPVRDYRQTATRALTLGRRFNVYVSAAPRTQESGKAADVPAGWVLWTDIDREDASDRLAAFPAKPSIVLETGTPGHLLAVWQLSEAIPGDAVKPANRRLALAVGGDMQATDAARVLRVCGTFNHKRQPPAPVVCIAIEPSTFTAGELVGNLPDPPEPERRRPPTQGVTLPSDDPLASIPAELYVTALTGREISSNGKLQCPFHADGQERTPSLHVYPDDGGWFCYGCERGGSIVDLGAAMYGLEPRGAGYAEIRKRLAADLLRTAA